MKQKIVIILAICVSLLVGAGSTFMLMQDADSDEIYLQPGIYGLQLSELWVTVANQTGIDNSTAILDQLRIRTMQDGSVKSLILEFYADNQDIHHWYHAELNPTGAITWYQSLTDDIPEGTHPLNLFTEIEQISYRELIDKRAGLAIEVDSQWGDLEYDAGYGDLFVLDNGKLTPLKRAVFHTDEPFYDIFICSRAENESVMGSGDPSSVKSESVIIPQNDSQYSIIFTTQDLKMAEIVEYYNESSQNARDKDQSSCSFHSTGPA